MTRRVELPGGEIIEFPANVSDAQIVAVLAEQFASGARKHGANTTAVAELRDGERLQRPNGAAIKHNAELQRHFVIDGRGVVIGWRVTLAEAIGLADAQPAPPRQQEPQPAPAERVPSAAEIAMQVRSDVEKCERQHRLDAVREAQRERHQRNQLHPALRRR